MPWRLVSVLVSVALLQALVGAPPAASLGLTSPSPTPFPIGSPRMLTVTIDAEMPIGADTQTTCPAQVSLIFYTAGGEPTTIQGRASLYAQCTNIQFAPIDASGTFDGRGFVLTQGRYTYSGSFDGQIAVIAGGLLPDPISFPVPPPPTPPPPPALTASPTPNPASEPPAPFEDSGARFSDLAGQVEINVPQPDGSYDDEDWHFAKLNQVLPAETHIRTADKSEALLSFTDASVFHLKPGSEIVLSSPVDKEGRTIKGHMKLLAGTIWANIKKMAKDGSMQVEMSQAVAGIKGTTFIVTDNLLSSTLQVVEGTVTFTANDDTQAIVLTGQQVTATADQGMSDVAPFDVSTATGYGTIDHSTLGPAPSDTPTPVAPALLLLMGAVIIAVIGLVAVFAVRRRSLR